MTSTFKADLLSMVNSELSLDPDVEITDETDLLMTGLVDSLGVMEIVNWVEEELSIEIDTSDIVLGHFQTVNLIVAFGSRLAASR